MNEKLNATVKLINNKIKFEGIARENSKITFDYKPPLGEGERYTGLEGLLLSLSACSGTAIVFLLRKMNKDILGLKINAEGIRKDQLPFSFQSISLEFIIKSKDVTESDFQ